METPFSLKNIVDKIRGRQSSEEIYRKLSSKQKTNMIIQSFFVGAGSQYAHSFYSYWLSEKLKLTPLESTRLLEKVFNDLDVVGQNEILRLAGAAHKGTMEEVNKQYIDKTALEGEDLSTERGRLLAGIGRELPGTLSNDFQKQMSKKCKTIPMDMNFTPGSKTTLALKKAAAELGCYKGVHWYEKLPPYHPLKQKG